MATTSSQAAALLSGGKLSELRRRILFVLGALLVFRLGTFVPVPGVNPEAMLRLFNQQQGTIIDMFNMFSGGALKRFSVFALGIMPYISASIIIQLMTASMPSLKELKKEGERGRQKINQYTRYFTVVLAAFQALGVAFALQQQSAGAGLQVVLTPGIGFIFSAVISLTAGTVFLMWLGEQITERGVGNGISLIIFAGIVAGLPAALANTMELARTGQLNPLEVLFLLALAIGITGFVVFVERGQRRLTVHYAQRMTGRQAYQNQTNYFPLKLNMSGVIPAIFASSLILFPATVATWFGSSDKMRWLQDFAALIGPGEPIYLLLYGALIAGFCFFYTALVFDPKETADNLKRSGAFIPGIRPGRQTAQFIDDVTTRLTTGGAIYLVAVCLLPAILRNTMSVPFYLGGTSLLIIVVVVMDFISQVQSHLMSHQYESLMKKANLRNYRRGAGG